jgi:hypothetical protein
VIFPNAGVYTTTTDTDENSEIETREMKYAWTRKPLTYTPGSCWVFTISVCDDSADVPLLAECISTMGSYR